MRYIFDYLGKMKKKMLIIPSVKGFKYAAEKLSDKFDFEFGSFRDLELIFKQDKVNIFSKELKYRILIKYGFLQCGTLEIFLMLFICI